MLESISSVLSGKRVIQDVDIKHAVQRIVREVVNSDAVYCQEYHKGKIILRVQDPMISQEVRIREYDILQIVRQKIDQPANFIHIVQG